MTIDNVEAMVSTAEVLAGRMGVLPEKRDRFIAAYVEASVTVNKQAEEVYAEFREYINVWVGAYHPGAPQTAKNEVKRLVDMMKKIAEATYAATRSVPQRAIRGAFVEAMSAAFAVAVNGGIQRAEIDEEFTPPKVTLPAGHGKVEWE